MAQFTIYSSADVGAPVLTGEVGKLLLVLDGCLVDGYGAKAAAGWTRPIPNAGNIGAYKQGAGSGFQVLVNDNGPNATSLAKEAWATGWETVATIAAPVGTGTGQFPTAAQLLTTGHTSVRKSVAASAVARDWIMFADDRTFYLFIATGDTAGWYYYLWFGDVYSTANTVDTTNCFIAAGNAENTAAAANHPWDLQNNVNTAIVGHFMARTYDNTGTSILLNKHGDIAKAGSNTLVGVVPTPNSADASFYLCPIYAAQSATSVVRGRFRGLYHLPHALAGFANGQTFSGTGAYAGKDFQVVLRGPNAGLVAIETSNTVDTN